MENSAKLQITLPFIYMSLNKNNVYCVTYPDLQSLSTHVNELEVDQSGKEFCSCSENS